LPALQDVAAGLTTLSWGVIGIYDLVSDSGYRCNGVVTSLVKFLEQWRHKEYCNMLYLQVESTNAAAFGLYQKLRFTT
jgi:ribosomal protein S18 acetylase RimI-like enzyme